jgi:hypothetical protein
MERLVKVRQRKFMNQNKNLETPNVPNFVKIYQGVRSAHDGGEKYTQNSSQ